MNLIETQVDDGVMTITMNDLARRNALSRQLMDELADACDAAENAADVRVVVLTNNGSVFCAGADLSEQSSVGEKPAIVLGDLFERISQSSKPYVGRINGHCVAGGVGLAAVMDVSVAVDSATFGFTEVRVGVAPAMISVVCLPKMGVADARAAFLRGNRFSAERAASMGLINEVVSADELDRTITEVLDDLLAGEPAALAAAKALSVRVPTMTVAEATTWTADLSARLFASDAAREGMTAFLEKRPAAWVRRRTDPTS
jgi:methylglutaconyl-CoA hydratase